MNNDKYIRVGIKTEGRPKYRLKDGFVEVDNMLIGDGFHWQKSIKAFLPGCVEEFKFEDVLNGEEASGDCQDSHITMVNILPLETYIQCVVGSEMNPEAPKEFIKAHAIISRSWALGKMLHLHQGGCLEEKKNGEIIGWDDTAEHKGFDVCSDDHCQRYQGLQEFPEETLRAIKETEGIVILDHTGNPADTRFSKCCGGTTELFSTCWQNRDYSYLRSFPDPWCNLSNITPAKRRILLSSILKDFDIQTQNYGYRWSSEISKEVIRKNLFDKFGEDIGEIERIESVHKGPSGRIDLLRLRGSERTLMIGKELWIRRLLSDTHLYSSAFTIEDLGDRVKLDGKGWGHGVGLCQIGAANMAANGKKFDEILSFYYPGTILGTTRFNGFTNFQKRGESNDGFENSVKKG